MSCLPSFHDCLTPKLPTIHSQIHPTHSGRKHRSATHKPKHSIENTPALKIVHISTTPWPRSRQTPPSSQITNQLNIRHFRLILPSSLCISLRPSRRAISSRQTQCPKTHFFDNTVNKFLKQVHPSSHVTTTATPQSQHRIRPFNHPPCSP